MAQASEPSFDALSHLLHTYAGPVDKEAAETPAETGSPESGARLAQIQADLALMAAGFETFRAAGNEQRALKNLPEYIVPALRPFFKDRETTLGTVYRTLAVTDYTWAIRFPEPSCDPSTRRAVLLGAKDGLFTDPISGEISSWLSRLLGPAAAGRSAEQALDRASSRQVPSAKDYELIRVKIARITEALNSEKAIGRERSKLYCMRAEAYESLAKAQQNAGSAPIQASRSSGEADSPDKAAASVLLIAFADGQNRYRAVGAGVMVETPQGPRVMTDARLIPVSGEEKPSLRAFTRGEGRALDRPRALFVDRIDRASGIMLGRPDDEKGIPALKIAQGNASRQDFYRAIGHLSASGAWTVSQGLVTEAGDGTFVSDAILGPDMIGGPLLNDSGEVVGLIVLSAGTGTAVAIQTEQLRRVIDGNQAAAQDLQFLEGRQSGSASLLTGAAPFVGELSVPGGGAVEAGLPDSHGGVNWNGGGGVGNWRPRSSAGPPSGYRSTSGSSSGSSSAAATGAAIGQDLGKALAPLVEALIFKGIPALFRGVGVLFKSKPSVSAPSQRRETAQQKTREPEKPKEPPKITGLVINLDRETLLEGERITATASVSFDDSSAKKDGIVIDFSLDPAGMASIADNLPGSIRRTNSAGQATITYEVNSEARDREQPFDALKQEESRRSGEEPISQVQPQRKPKNEYERVKAKMQDRFERLDDEEEKVVQAEAAAAPQADAPENDAAAPTEAGLVTAPVPVKMEALYALTVKAGVKPGNRPVAPGSKLDDDKNAEVQSGRCPTGLVAVMAPPEPPGGSPGSPAHIDPLKAKQLFECKEIEDRVLAKCGDNLACAERELKSEKYFEQGCESRWRKLGGVSPGSIGTPNIARRSGNYWCLPARARTARGTQIYSRGAGAGESKEDDGESSPAKTQALIDRILSILKPNGRWIGERVGDAIRIRGTLEDAVKLFEQLTQGMRPKPHPNPNVGPGGRLARQGDINIGLRPVSHSGPPTIDVNLPGLRGIEVKFIDD